MRRVDLNFLLHRFLRKWDKIKNQYQLQEIKSSHLNAVRKKMLTFRVNWIWVHQRKGSDMKAERGGKYEWVGWGLTPPGLDQHYQHNNERI